VKLLILGATGATGRHLLEQAIAKGHGVTALVRDPATMTFRHERLTVVKGRATVAAEVDPVVAGQDAVISVLGPRDKGDPVCPDTAQALVPAMTKHGVKRLVWLSAGGVGDSEASIVAKSFVFGRIILPLFLRKPYANHARAEEILRASALEWTVVRPLQLVDEPSGKPVTATFPGGAIMGLKIARKDVAMFILREVEAREHVGRMPMIYA
jgi:putative NADH-flavin reductase